MSISIPCQDRTAVVAPDPRPVLVKGSEMTLAQRLSRGELPLAFALQSASDVALALRDIHAAGRVYGAVDSASVLLGESSARLAMAPNRSGSREADIRGYGAVVDAMVHGVAASADRAALIASAMDLANRCMFPGAEGVPDMQKVLMEVQLLALMARRLEAPCAIAVPPPPPLPPVEPPVIAAERVASSEPWIVDVTPTAERCPQCQSNYVYESKARGWLEELVNRLGVPLYRCHRCYHRFWMILRVKIARNSTTPILG